MHHENIMPFIIATIAFLVFTSLLWQGQVGEASYCFLVALAIMLGLVLHGFGRLQELDLKNLRLVLREIDETKRELLVREEKLKAIAIPLAQVIALTGASEGRIGSREGWKVKRNWYKKNLKELIEALELSSGESLETLKYVEKYNEIDEVLGDREGLKTTDTDYKQTKEKLEKLSNDLMEMMKKDMEQ
jgi:hypothetical protein